MTSFDDWFKGYADWFSSQMSKRQDAEVCVNFSATAAFGSLELSSSPNCLALSPPSIRRHQDCLQWFSRPDVSALHLVGAE
jgi:hypothetical protein